MAFVRGKVKKRKGYYPSTSSEGGKTSMEHKFRRIAALSKAEFEAEVENMTPAERHAFYWWLQHEVDQSEARAEQAQENSDAIREGQRVLEAHGFGTPGREMLGDVWPLLTPEEQHVVAKALGIMSG